MRKDQGKLPAGLYMVATPIGNLEDLSLRALRILREADWIAAEDTRETRKLLESQGITKELVSLHEHSAARKAQELAERLRKGEAGAYVSDAGTPGISDPGADLVRAATALQVNVVPVPGPSAPIALLSASGFSASAFAFHGFFPREKKEREEWAEENRKAGGLHLAFESPHRIRECLKFLAETFPEKPLVVGRELTKRFETITRGTAASVEEELGREDPRGEYVWALDLGPAPAPSPGPDPARIEALLRELAGLGAGQKILVKAAMSHGLAKNAAYELALKAQKA